MKLLKIFFTIECTYLLAVLLSVAIYAHPHNFIFTALRIISAHPVLAQATDVAPAPAPAPAPSSDTGAAPPPADSSGSTAPDTQTPASTDQSGAAASPQPENAAPAEQAPSDANANTSDANTPSSDASGGTAPDNTATTPASDESTAGTDLSSSGGNEPTAVEKNAAVLEAEGVPPSVLLDTNIPPAPEINTNAPILENPAPQPENAAPAEQAPSPIQTETGGSPEQQTAPAGAEGVATPDINNPNIPPSETGNAAEQQTAPAPAGAEGAPAITEVPLAPIVNVETPETATVVDQTAAAADAITDSIQNTVSDPAKINPELIDEAKKEDAAIAESPTPEAQTPLLFQFTENQVDKMDGLISQNDFADANLVTQRINNDIDHLLDHVNELPPAAGEQAKQGLVDLCNEREGSLRSNALIVPENLEQDVEITRGKCLNIQQNNF